MTVSNLAAYFEITIMVMQTSGVVIHPLTGPVAMQGPTSLGTKVLKFYKKINKKTHKKKPAKH